MGGHFFTLAGGLVPGVGAVAMAGKTENPGQVNLPLFTCQGEALVPDERLLGLKILLRPDEVARILRVSRRKVYSMLDFGELDGVKVGQAVRVSSRSVLDFLERAQEV